MKKNCADYGPSILRLVLGPLFIIPGLMKLSDPGMITGLLESLGFPAPAFFGWLVLLSEILFGASVFLGWKVKQTVWPLVIILAVATLTVHLPNLATNPANVLFHLLGIAALVSIHMTGPGAVAVKNR